MDGGGGTYTTGEIATEFATTHANGACLRTTKSVRKEGRTSPSSEMTHVTALMTDWTNAGDRKPLQRT